MALPSSYGIEKNRNSLEGLRAYENGGKGSGNWGHAGRPGEVGGSAPSGSSSASIGAPESSSQSTIGKRFARKARVEELRDEWSEMDDYEAEERAEDAYRLAEAEDKVKSELETKRGKDKKRAKDTPGKKETLEAEEEWKKALAAEEKAENEFDIVSEKEKVYARDDYYLGHHSPEYEKLREKAAKAQQKREKAADKLAGALSSQLMQDKDFKGEITKALEAGMDIKLEKPLEFRAGNKKNYNGEVGVVEVSGSIPTSDLGALKGLTRSAWLEGKLGYGDGSWSDSYGDRDHQPRVGGSIYLSYRGKGGGGNSKKILDAYYYPDGTFDIEDRRGWM